MVLRKREEGGGEATGGSCLPPRAALQFAPFTWQARANGNHPPPSVSLHEAAVKLLSRGALFSPA